MDYTRTHELYKLFKKSNGVCIDSRVALSGQLFFAIKGDNFDGNKYAEKALVNCSYAIVDDPSAVKGEKYILVDDALDKLQRLAAYHRKRLGLPIIAITGTNGKTTTKELVASVMSEHYKVSFTQGNFNNHLGVPLTLLSFTSEDEFGIVEMGANHVGEIALLCKMAAPDFGIITNVGKAHLEGFGSFEGVKKAKSELYEYLRENDGTAFVNYDNEQLEDMNPPHSIVYYGKGGFTHCQGRIKESDSLYLALEWLVSDKVNDEEPDWDKGSVTVETNLVGEYNYENILAAICIGNNFDIPYDKIVGGVKAYVPTNNRSQIVKTSNNTLILDGYNANPSSMNVALRNFAQVKAERKVVILGDMFELGRTSIAEHGVLLGLTEELCFTQVILVGKEFYELKSDSNLFFEDGLKLQEYLKENPIKEAFILIKGSRGMHLEDLRDYL